MYKHKRISVSVPAFNEDRLIIKTIKSIPKFVDFIVVVNDGSTDKTSKKVNDYANKDKRIYLLDLKKNIGVGGSIIKAHIKSIELGSDILVVMAGDDQMDPKYLPLLLNEIIENNVDYAKGNRFFHQKDLRSMPLFRIIGNVLITFLTKICTGYWSISDPLNGYTALESSKFREINTENLEKRYDFEISILRELYMTNAKIKDVFIPARYGKEKSTIKGLSFKNPNSYFQTVLRTNRTLFKGFLKRILVKYILFSFHPIALFLISGSILFFFGLCYGIYIAIYSIGPQSATTATVMLSVIPFISGFQLILQSIALDIQNEPK